LNGRSQNESGNGTGGRSGQNQNESGEQNNSKQNQSGGNGNNQLNQSGGGWLEGIIGWSRRLIDPNFCYTNADCASDEICKPGLGCTAPPRCSVLRRNETSTSQIRLLFIGDGFRTDEDVRKAVEGAVDWNGTSFGLMSLEPFKSQKGLFDIYYIRSNQSLALGKIDKLARIDEQAVRAQKKACGTVDQVILLSKQSFRSYSVPWENEAYVSLGGEWLAQEQNRIVAHEFGHSFGKLQDERAVAVLEELTKEGHDGRVMRGAERVRRTAGVRGRVGGQGAEGAARWSR